MRGERCRVQYIFGLSGNRALCGLAYEDAGDVKVRRAKTGADEMRSLADFAMPPAPGDAKAGSWLGWRRRRGASMPAT